MRKKLTLTIDEHVLDKYKKYCLKFGLNLSRRLEKFMEKDMKKWKRL